ncbi:MAG TPA: FAD-dependent oxidoreductase [Candidatus Binatia bacterium]|jgi:2-polyprenyl-6-methoxyphenol hydroxylase-like FAD-dependent oxidoreductase
MEDRGCIGVLICGAGVAGLTLAIELARRDVSFRLIDKLPGPFDGSRGKGIQPRTLEVFEDLGVVDRIAAAGGSYPPQRLHRPDGTFDETQNVAIEPPTADEPYRTPLLVPQSRTEAVMRERLAELGHVPEYGNALQAFEQDADMVTAHVVALGRTEMVRCRYLIGSDGGRSLVRDGLQLGFPGKTLGVRAIVADIVLDGLTRDAWHRFHEGDMTRQLSFCPLPHGELFQLQAPIPLEGDVDLSTEGLQAFVDARLPGDRLVVRGVAWASAYSMNARLADRYRVGRVFLMGDAAHIHPPTGGQGLNTSVQDAYNLGWKLEAVLAGAPDALLETYAEERRPIAADMLGLATDLLEKARQGDMRRGREVHQLDLGYPWSSLSLRSPERRGRVAAGDRAPDAPLRGAAGQPTRLFDLLRGPHWTLLTRGRDAAGLPIAGRRLHIHRIGPSGDVQDVENRLSTTYGMRDGDHLLVRPDGYVGALVTAAEGARIGDYLSRVRCDRSLDRDRMT